MTLQTFPVFYKKTTNLLCFFGWFICLSLISVANRHKCLLHFGKKGWRLFCIICTYDDLQRVTWLINRLYTRSPETTSDNSLKEEKRVWRIKSDVLEKSYTMCFQFWWDSFFYWSFTLFCVFAVVSRFSENDSLKHTRNPVQPFPKTKEKEKQQLQNEVKNRPTDLSKHINFQLK